MQIETTDRICPLCKREDAENKSHDSTRLCHDCRAMIETILPKSASSVGVAVAQPQYAVAAARRMEVAAPLEFGNEAGGIEPLPQEEDYELVSLEPEIGVKKDFMEEPEESFAHTAETAETISEQTRYAEPETFKPPQHSEAIDEDQHASELSQAAGLPRAEATASEALPEDIGKLKEAVDESATDPWDDPLPAWEYSRNEWPLLLEHKKPSALARFKIPIAIAILIASVMAVYLFLLRPRSETPQETIAVATPEPDKTTESGNTLEPDKATESDKSPATAGDEQQASAPASDATPVSNAATAPSSDKQQATAQTKAGEDDNTKWRHSLQAMASPTEAEANQFAERLVRAGVPAYVVAADLGSRGRWYRVRVGRFTSAGDALRFAAEARQRANAAGVSLKALNLCEYEKP